MSVLVSMRTCGLWRFVQLTVVHGVQEVEERVERVHDIQDDDVAVFAHSTHFMSLFCPHHKLVCCLGAVECHCMHSQSLPRLSCVDTLCTEHSPRLFHPLDQVLSCFLGGRGSCISIHHSQAQSELLNSMNLYSNACLPGIAITVGASSSNCRSPNNSTVCCPSISSRAKTGHVFLSKLVKVIA